VRLKQQVHKAEGITLRLFIIIVLLLLTLIAFWAIADEIVLEKNNRFDTFIFQKLSFLTSPFITRLMVFFTFFGSNRFLRPAYILLIIYFLLFKKDTKLALTIAAIGLCSSPVVPFLKDIFRRVRPSDPLIQDATGFSFPSGHSFSAFTFFGLLTYIIWQSEMNRRWKYLFSVLFILCAACIAFSRVYLHVHYPSDVIAGFCLSILWLSISLWILNKITTKFNI
jgi:undecaprenyl-diphosphatase